MKIPCKNCITLAICRHKCYNDIHIECHLVRSYIFPGSILLHKIHVKEVERVLKPSKWSLGKSIPVGFTIEGKKDGKTYKGGYLVKIV
jgi:hypothetical protein